MQQMVIDRRGFFAGGATLGAAILARPAWALAPVKSDRAVTASAALFDAYVADNRLPGAVGAIGRGTAAANFALSGKQGREPNAAAMAADSLFRCYSMTKPITGMVAMMLIEDGKLRLEQDVGDFVPGFRKPMVALDPEKSLDARPAARPLTIRHLLTHSGGLGYAIVSKGALHDAFVSNGLASGAVSRMALPGVDAIKPAPSLAAFAERLATLPLIADPDTRWSYSCGLDLLGHVIELASGMDFEAFLRKRLFGPLGMTSSWFQVPQSELPRMTTNYGILGTTRVPIDPGAATIFADRPVLKLGGSGLVMSPRDYDRFLQMLAGRGAIGRTRVMKEATVRLAMSNLLAAGVDTAGTFVAGQGFGAGGRVRTSPNALNEGIGTFGWGGAAATVAWVDPSTGVRAAGFAQFMPDSAMPFTKEFARTVYTSL